MTTSSPPASAAVAAAHPSPVAVPSSGAEAIVQVLADEGVAVIFGYSGGAILPVYDAVFRHNALHPRDDGSDSMPLVVPANEQGAGFMAAGYARASGKVGVAIVTSGPGATNMVTPVRDSMADSVPLVVICGQVGTAAIGSDAFQEAPVSNIMGACAKHVFLVTDAAQLETTVRTAFTLARSGRPGPVVVDVPKDVQNAAIAWRGSGELLLGGYRSRLRTVEQASLSDADCAAFFAALAQARRPLIYAGGGVIAADASAALRAFVDAFALPVTTTLMGLGAFDSTVPLALHMLGMHGTAYANYAVEDCDFVLALGARFDDRVAGVPDKFAPRAKFIAQVDIDPAEIGKVKRVDWHHIGPLTRALERLTAYGRAHGIAPKLAAWHAHVAELKRTHAMDYDRASALIQPHAVIEALNRHTQGRAIISTGVGQHQMWAMQYLPCERPRSFLTSGGHGTMGFGLPAAIGARAARPEATVVCVDGDGSFLMTCQELGTAVAERLPVVVVVLDNGGLGMVRQWQEMFYDGRLSQVRPAPQADIAAVARGFGARAFTVRIEGELCAAFGAALACGETCVLDVKVEPGERLYPMIEPGAAAVDVREHPGT